MFVPQMPYICEGTLRELVTYPELLPLSNQRQTDLLDGLMRTVGLEYLAPREGGWDVRGRFDIHIGLCYFSRISQQPPPSHAPWDVLYRLCHINHP